MPFPGLRCLSRRVPTLLPMLVLACGEAVVETPPAVPTTLAITPSSAVLASLGETVQLTATVRDQTGRPMSGVGVNWASSDAGILTVDAAGVVTATGNGSTNITATVQGGGASGSAAITVAQRVTEVRLTPEPQVLRAIGETLQMSAEALDANSHSVAGSSFTWSSSNEAVVTVSADGLVSAAGNGSANVTASAGSVSAAADFSVEQRAASITVSPDEASLNPGDTLQLTAEALDANGNPVVDADFAWLSDDESVATVDIAGLVTGVAPGSAEISVQLPGTGLVATSRITVQQVDRVALVALYNALGGASWDANHNWLTDAPIGTWHGVTADAQGRVTALELPRNGLVGPLPPELAYLTSLRILDLANNRLSAELPAYLADFTNLEDLNLAFNRLTGPIPPELANLVNLGVLNIEKNDLTGTIPPQLANLSGLRLLALAGNRLTGTIPPALGNLSGLRHLGLHENQLSGGIPPSLGRLRNVTLLSLCCNALTGTIPPELGNLSSVEFLGLHTNRLTGTLPPELGRLTALRRLYFSVNSGLTGPIPQDYTSLRLNTFSWVQTQLCSPSNQAFQAWLGGIHSYEGGPVCTGSSR